MAEELFAQSERLVEAMKFFGGVAAKNSGTIRHAVKVAHATRGGSPAAAQGRPAQRSMIPVSSGYQKAKDGGTAADKDFEEF